MQGVNAKLITNPAMQGIDAAYPTFREKRNTKKDLKHTPRGYIIDIQFKIPGRGIRNFGTREKGV